jgi:hypothetical protein
MEDAIQPMVVGFPLYDGVTLMDFVGATDVFSVAYGILFPSGWPEKKGPSKHRQVLLYIPIILLMMHIRQ